MNLILRKYDKVFIICLIVLTTACNKAEQRNENISQLLDGGLLKIVYQENAENYNADYLLLYKNEDVMYFLERGSRTGAEFVYFRVHKYDSLSSKLVESAFTKNFEYKSGILLGQQGRPSNYVWVPLMDESIPTGAKEIYEIDFETEKMVSLVNLPDSETLDGSDPCDRYSSEVYVDYIDDFKIQYAVYSLDRINKVYGEPCTSKYDLERQKEIATQFNPEIRMIEIHE